MLFRQALKRRIRRRWDLVADWWSASIGLNGDFSRSEIIIPRLNSLSYEFKGTRIIDAGCGEGYFSRWLLKKGAKVTGIDISPKMIDFARRKNGTETQYIVGDIESPLNLNESSHDFCFSINVFMDIGYPERVFRYLSNILKEHGILVMVIPHPSTFGPNGIGIKLWKGRQIHKRKGEILYTTQIDGNSPVRTYYFYRDTDWYIKRASKYFDKMNESDLYLPYNAPQQFWTKLKGLPIFKLLIFRRHTFNP